MEGYNGKIAYVDLTNKEVRSEDITQELIEQYIGGVGLSAKLTYDLLNEEDYETLKQNHLAESNPLIFATGPLTGTATPSSSRYSVTGISPLTGIWGESTSGGFFPIALKRSGYDAVVFTGKSKELVYLSIIDGKVEINSAEKYSGLNTRQTIAKLREDMNEPSLRIACIGKGGENLVKYAAVINDEGRAAGRCGLGAIMGSKNLKAIAIKGRNKIEYSDNKSIVKSGKSALNNVMNQFSTNFFSNYGTLCYSDMGMVLGDIPANYFTNTEFRAENITGKRLKEDYPVIKYACAGCSIGCGRTTIMSINGEEIEIDGPEYETVAAFGPLCGVLDFRPILEANHICNLEGIDTISSGVCISFLIYLVENDIKKEKIADYLDGIKLEEIKWGNEGLILKLLQRIVEREGIGDLLAEGVKVMADKLDVDPDLAAHVKGLEIPMHDPRAYDGQALSYMTCCIGASHEKGDFFNVDGDAASFRKINKGDRFDINGREESVLLYQDLANIFDSAVICNFPHINVSTLGRLLKAATGISSLGKRKEIFTIGERATNLKRLISCKLGISRADDKLPAITTKALSTGGTAGHSLDLQDNLKKYYELRSWDWQTGCPTDDKLSELQIK